MLQLICNTNLKYYKVLRSFGLVLERKTGKKIPESSRLEFVERFSAKKFTLAEDSISCPLIRGVIAYLRLLRPLLAIHQKFQEPRFWKVMDCFVLLAYKCLAASRTLLWQLVAYLNFNLGSENLLCL